MADAPCSPSATMALVLRAPAAIAEPAEVDAELAEDIAACVKRWAGVQAFSLATIVLAAQAAESFVALSALALVAFIGNHFADRAAAREMEELGLSPRLARAMLRRMYTLPAAYDLTSMLSLKRMTRVVRRALAAL